MNFTASCLDQLDCPSVCDALGGLAVDLHYLISDLRGRYTLLLFALGALIWPNYQQGQQLQLQQIPGRKLSHFVLDCHNLRREL